MSTPYTQLGGADAVRALVERFYDVMSEKEPELARLHECEPEGIVARGPRDRFAMFLIGWLGGPDDYIQQHGHPRLRMRHAAVAVDSRLAEAWVRTMCRAMDELHISGDVRDFLEERFRHVAFFLRNTGDQSG